MAEPVRRRGPRSRGARSGRGARGSRAARGRPSRARQSPSRRIRDTVLVDLVSDSDEEILEVAAARGDADLVEVRPQVEVPSAGPPGLVAPQPNSDSDSEGADEGPAGAPRTLVRRRRRLLGPDEAPVVPVYSGKVQSSLNLIPDNASLLKLYPTEAEEETDVIDSRSPSPEDPPLQGSPWKKKLRNKPEKEEMEKEEFLDEDISPLPRPSSRNKSKKHTEALQKLREVNKRLQDLRSCLSPKQHQSSATQNLDDEVVLVEGPVLPESPRLLPLKIRCRADLIRLPVRMGPVFSSCVLLLLPWTQQMPHNHPELLQLPSKG